MTTEQELRLVADMESFSPSEDRLSELVGEEDDEMDESMLELISAAGAKPPFAELLRRRGTRDGG